jgi:hypothetical protein
VHKKRVSNFDSLSCVNYYVYSFSVFVFIKNRLNVVGWNRIFPHLGFTCFPNFWKFAQMRVAHLGNVCQCESSLQTSSFVKCFNHSINFDAKLIMKIYQNLMVTLARVQAQGKNSGPASKARYFVLSAFAHERSILIGCLLLDSIIRSVIHHKGSR